MKIHDALERFTICRVRGCADDEIAAWSRMNRGDIRKAVHMNDFIRIPQGISETTHITRIHYSHIESGLLRERQDGLSDMTGSQKIEIR